MLILLSPSKTIDTTTKISYKNFTIPHFITDSSNIISVVKQLNVNELSTLMKISPKLSQLNFDRFQYWNSEHKLTNSKQALLSFKGEVFTGIDSDSFSEDDLKYSQNHLIILSGMYGIIRPLDLIQPYRLEISTKLAISDSKNLYAFWQDKITSEIQQILTTHNNPTIINLASNEYFKVIDAKKLDANIITPVFKEYKNGSYKIVTIYAKKARGLMTSYILKNKIEKIDDLKFFDKEGYYYNDLMSNNSQLVFTRG
jgi:cytoplasmic iron level regulating protein YaaA (DUF328/UPF0246 family)